MKKVDIVIPSHNEEKILEQSLTYLYSYLKELKNIKWKVIIGENGSTDGTYLLGKKLEKKFPNMSCMHLDIPSRDAVLKDLWGKSKSNVMLYMDADMSTNPKFAKELIDAIVLEGYDVAIGSRLKRGAKIKRPLVRVLMSKLYNYVLLPIILPTGVSDAQCGFKAINQKTAKEILPRLGKQNGFLDTELLAVSHYRKFKVKEIPVEWAEAERKSTMNVYDNVLKFLKNIFITRRKILNGFYD